MKQAIFMLTYFVYIWYMFTIWCVRAMHVMVHVGGQKITQMLALTFHLIFWGRISLVFCVLQVRWTISFQKILLSLPHLHLQTYHRSPELQTHTTMSGFYTGSRDPNSGCQACTTSTFTSWAISWALSCCDRFLIYSPGWLNVLSFQASL